MPEFINFDTLEAEIISIQRNGKRYDLRDDVPFETLIQTLPLLNQFTNIGDGAEEATATDAAIADWLGPMQAKSTHLLGEIFRHTLPEVTDDEIARQFSLTQRIQLIRIFFTRIGSEYKTLPNATATLPEPTPPVRTISGATPKRKR